MLEVSKGTITHLTLYPTVISEFQALRARGTRQGQIVGKMSELCSELGTLARWSPAKEALEIMPASREAQRG